MLHQGRTLLLAICLVSVYGFDRRRFPGPYCETRQPQQCCPGRDDTCTVPIHDTLCYCDQFCGEHSVEDCCPDFQDVCGTGPKPTPPAEDNQCIKEGKFFTLGDEVKNGCNTCTCVNVDSTDNVERRRWSCTEQACINEQELVNRINSGGYSWKATTYDKFDGVALNDGVKYYLGTIKPKNEVLKLNPLLIKSDEQFETTFDTRDAWPSTYTHPAMDQGQCASSWAFSTANNDALVINGLFTQLEIGVAADRWSIQSQGVFKDQMSVQNLISCNRFVDGCVGGRVEDAWWFLQFEGAVEDQCYPYTSGDTRDKGTCKYVEEIICPNGKPAHVHQTTPAYRIAQDEKQIMKEIKTQGPVQAIITVYPDFYLYEQGVYQHTNEEAKEQKHDHTLSGTHSVKIIGWGEENGVKYWLCVNSWGRQWGEDGMVRIKRGSNESGIEDFIVGVWARVEKHELSEHEESKIKQRFKFF